MAASAASATGRRPSGTKPMLDLPVMPSTLPRLLAPGFGLELVFDCSIPGEPVAKARAKQGKTRDGRKIWYTPDETAAQEQSIRAYVEGWMLATRKQRQSGPLIVEVHSYASRPASNKKPMHTQRPDADNLFKVVDALNGVAWDDDCQIVAVLSQKGWAVTPKVRIVLYKVSHESLGV